MRPRVVLWLRPVLERCGTLRRLSRTSAGRVRLAFDRPGAAEESDFDRVVLAIPFTTLRSVERHVELPPAKLRSIQELGYGTNAKLIGAFDARVWNADGRNGNVIADNGLPCGWDALRGQDQGATAAYTVFPGGSGGLACGRGSAEDAFAASLPALNRVFKGASGAHRAGSALRMHWPTAPYALGSYTCFRPGQTFDGIADAAGPIHFAGEHTSLLHQGYMEGAAESGDRCAAEITASR